MVELNVAGAVVVVEFDTLEVDTHYILVTPVAATETADRPQVERDYTIAVVVVVVVVVVVAAVAAVDHKTTMTLHQKIDVEDEPKVERYIETPTAVVVSDVAAVAGADHHAKRKDPRDGDERHTAAVAVAVAKETV